jgi:hypothetical protein
MSFNKDILEVENHLIKVIKDPRNRERVNRNKERIVGILIHIRYLLEESDDHEISYDSVYNKVKLKAS